jgi:hypothetical protein
VTIGEQSRMMQSNGHGRIRDEQRRVFVSRDIEICWRMIKMKGGRRRKSHNKNVIISASLHSKF